MKFMRHTAGCSLLEDLTRIETILEEPKLDPTEKVNTTIKETTRQIQS